MMAVKLPHAVLPDANILFSAMLSVVLRHLPTTASSIWDCSRQRTIEMYLGCLLFSLCGFPNTKCLAPISERNETARGSFRHNGLTVREFT